MFNFDKFPTKLRYEKFDKDGNSILIRDVMVYGYLCDKHLLVVEELDTVADVYMVPVNVFNERFEGYVVVVE